MVVIKLTGQIVKQDLGGKEHAGRKKDGAEREEDECAVSKEVITTWQRVDKQYGLI